ncbi:hypothetical protein V2S66_33475 [Streptomyces sp. V4-01]|uniref:Uncharacterized protein n=1 Tax=Actinacidiphila polyblastidii TaxID=3110430 RepID=A0ABU7PM00_9ACTN|nr:hypothetical protein [Streptomyces sp. V4-01]
MKTRQFGFWLWFGCVLVASIVGYSLNDGSPSIPWAVGGAVVGAAAVALVRLRRGR